MKRKIVIAILCAAVSMGTVGCGNSTASAKKTQTQTDKKEDSKSENSEKSSEEKQSRDIFAMDTYMTVTAYGEHASEAVDKAETEIKRLDEMLSTGNENSEVYKLNQNGEAVVSDDTAYLYERSEKIYKQTKGVFDISIYPVMDAWGFTTENYRIPAEDELSALLKNVDASKIQYDKKTKKITLPKNVKIDFGGIAKGYTSSRIMQIYKKCGAWNENYESLLDELKDSKRTVCYRTVLISENEKKRLLDDVMENPYDLFYYGKYLVKDYPEQVYELCYKEISESCALAKDRREYKKITKNIAQLIKWKGNDTAKSLIEELMQRYPRKPALLDELEKVEKKL